MDPKQFIQAVFITDLDALMAIDKPYISFMVMANGIEFLGRCLSKSQDWNEDGVSGKRFKEAIKKLPALQKYVPYIKKKVGYELYSSLRCGLAHTAKPKHAVTLSSKGEDPHLQISNGRLNLRCEDFHADFKAACNHIIAMNFPGQDKMNKPFLHVPDTITVHSGNIPNINSSGSTS